MNCGSADTSTHIPQDNPTHELALDDYPGPPAMELSPTNTHEEDGYWRRYFIGW
jgi:hypothetical protein